MKSSKFFIKSNYIKNTKNDWIYCDGKLLYHQNITFLHLKTENFDKIVSDGTSEIGSHISGFSTLSQMYQSKGRKQRLNVLCNLSQFKSCEIKSVNFENLFKFAIKLVPVGFLRSKKLYLLPDVEDSLTEWCGILTGFVSKMGNIPTLDSAADDKSAMTISSTLRVTKMAEKTYQSSTLQDVYISLDENDAYEHNTQDEFYLVTVEQTADSVKLDIKGNYIMKLGLNSLELLEVSTREAVHSFPYSSIRRFGAKESLFRLEAGRHCTTGNGSFIFRLKDAVRIAEKLKNNTRQKKLSQNITHNSCMTLNKPSTSEISLQISPKINNSVNTKACQSMEIITQNDYKPSGSATLSRNSTLMNSRKNSNGLVYENKAENRRRPSYEETQKPFMDDVPPEIIPRVKHHQNKEVKIDDSIKLLDQVPIEQDTRCDSIIVQKCVIDMGSQDRSSNIRLISASKRPDVFEISPTIVPTAKTDEKPVNDAQLHPKISTLVETSSDRSTSLNYVNIANYHNNAEFEIKEEIEHPMDKTDSKLEDICSEKVHTIVPDNKTISKSNEIVQEVPTNDEENESDYFPSINASDLRLHNYNSMTSDLFHFKSDDSINSSQVSDKDQRPTSLFESSASQMFTPSTSGSNNSPNFNSLPYPAKPVTSDYTTSESTFFKYRKLPKPPIRTTPPLNLDSQRTSFINNSQSTLSSLGRSDSASLPKKTPPPVLPKPKLKLSQNNIDSTSFREFDQMLKNLNLSFC